MLSRDQQRLILNLMCRESGISDIAEVTKHSTTTVRRYIARFGEALAASHDRLVRGHRSTRLECDEIFSFVYVRFPEKPWSGKVQSHQVGEFYTWTGFDPDSKLLVSWHVGRRGFHDCLTFMTDLKGRVSGRQLITTDGLEAYRDAIQQTFGADADHVVIKKALGHHYDEEKREAHTHVLAMYKQPQNQAKVDLTLASTSLVERFNGTIRNFNPRFRRKTYKFSKKHENHVHAQAIAFMYYNWVKPHTGLPKGERKLTPAIKAGLTTKVWTYDDLLDEVDLYWRNKAAQSVLRVAELPRYTPVPPGEWSIRPYFVSFSPKKRIAKVHTATCRDARRAGAGRKEGPRANLWYAFETEGGARKCAETLAPLEHSVCSICIVGHYAGNAVTGRGPDGHKTVG